MWLGRFVHWLFAVLKIIQNCDDMGASGSRNFKWARVRPGSKHLRSLLDWCFRFSCLKIYIDLCISVASHDSEDIRDQGLTRQFFRFVFFVNLLEIVWTWMLRRPSWLMRTPRMKKTASAKRAKMRSISLFGTWRPPPLNVWFASICKMLNHSSQSLASCRWGFGHYQLSCHPVGRRSVPRTPWFRRKLWG